MNRQNIPSDFTQANARQSLKTENILSYYDSQNSSDDMETVLLTERGEKTVYDAVVPCNRCGACASICPSYQASRKETLSPRGRSQLARLLKEFRLKNPPEALREALTDCFLCGACTDICHASVPVPEIIVDLRKHYLKVNPGLRVKTALRLKLRYPVLYDLWLRTGLLLLQLRLPWFAKLIWTPALLGMTPTRLQTRNIKFSFRTAKARLKKKFSRPPKHSVKWIYFSSCDTNYLMPEVAEATVSLLERHSGEGMTAENFCCGMASWRYGRTAEAREFAKKNIMLFEELRRKHGKFIIVTDCSSCAAFLKKYEQLFIRGIKEEELLREVSEKVTVLNPDPEENPDYGGDEEEKVNDGVPAGLTSPSEKQEYGERKDYSSGNETAGEDDFESWRLRAREFAASVRDISEVINTGDFQKLGNCAEAENEIICMQDSCSAVFGQKIHDNPYKLLRHIAGSRFRDLPGGPVCCGGTKANITVNPALSEYSSRKKMHQIASIQAGRVITTDPCCLLQLNAVLPHWYPSAKACHLSVYLNDIENRYRRTN